MPVPSPQPQNGVNPATIAARMTDVADDKTLGKSADRVRAQRAWRQADKIGNPENLEALHADRSLAPAHASVENSDHKVLCIVGHAPDGRRFRIRFVPKEIEQEAPVGA